MSKSFSKTDVKKGTVFLFAAILGIAVTLGFMAVFAVLMLFLELDRAYSAPFATLSTAIGSFFAALYSAKKIGDKGYLLGLIIGGVVFGAVFLVSLAVDKSSVSLNTLFHLVIILLSSVTGGIVGVNKGKNKKYI